MVAQPALNRTDPALVFGARLSVEDVSMSPDGTKIAYIAPRSRQGAAVFVKVELIVYPERDHCLDDSQVRDDMLRKSDAFLRTSMGL